MLGSLAQWSWSLRLWFLWSNPWVQCYGSLCRWAAVCPLTWPTFHWPLKAQLSRLAVARTFLELCHSALEDDWAALLDIPLKHACLPFFVDQERFSTICPGESQALLNGFRWVSIHSDFWTFSKDENEKSFILSLPRENLFWCIYYYQLLFSFQINEY